MNPSYIGAVWMFGGNFAPYGFAYCDGSLQSIQENETLYTLLGTTYGGDGVSSFGLPDLRGRVVIGQGQGPGLPNYALGQKSGSEQVTLTTSNIPSHNHLLNVGTAASSDTPAAALYLSQLAVGGNSENIYSTSAGSGTFVSSTIGTAGGSIPIEIVQPVTAISYVIALFGIYPSQN